MKHRISVDQEVEQVNDGGKVTDVELNVYSHFKATPASLRRSFDALMKQNLRGFVGRQFVFDALDEFLITHESGYFIIRSVPGVGKSALMAKLVNDRGYVHHFNIASLNIRSTRVFLESVCAQLIARYGLEHKELPPGATDDGSFLTQCLREAAADRKNHPIVLAIDALDEADQVGLPPRMNLLYLPFSLPEGVYIVATTRPLYDLHLRVAEQQVLDLEADSEGNQWDITTYIEAYVEQEGMRARLSDWGLSEEQFVATLKRKSQGNFMYLAYMLGDIRDGRLTAGNIDNICYLPNGLEAYYRRHWRYMRTQDEERFDMYQEPVVCFLATAQTPVTIAQIEEWTQLRPIWIKRVINEWREFLSVYELGEGETLYRIYHPSFQDFLKAEVGLVQYHDRIAVTMLRKIPGFLDGGTEE